MLNILLVMIGGALGSVARFAIGRATAGLSTGFNWPVGTYAANLSGGLLMGVLMGLLLGPLKSLQWGVIDAERARLFFGVGVLGGFTTFSSFSLETMMMLERRDYATAALYVSSSVILSVLAVMAGLILVRKLVSA